MRNATWPAAILAIGVAGAGCATSHVRGAPDGDPGPADAAGQPDARPRLADAPPAPGDARPGDAAGAPDAADVGTADAAACAISTGDAITLTGTGDLSRYPSAQVLTPGATLAADDAVAITWDASDLYVTVTSDAFLSDYEPLHVYVQAGAAPLDAAAPGAGKEYGGLTAALPFTATHLIAVRRVSDSGTGPYDGVYTPGGTPAWATRATPLVEGTDVLVSSDLRTISVQVPWAALGGCPTELRLAAHVVHGAAGNEWKDLVPTTTTPWLADGGGYYDVDLTGAPDIGNWALR